MEYLALGPTPSDEECAQVGTDDYAARAKRECVVFEAQLVRQFGESPVGACLCVKGFPHDFGTYYEVVVKYDDNNPEAVEYAFKLENESPANWDEQAKKELEVVHAQS